MTLTDTSDAKCISAETRNIAADCHFQFWKNRVPAYRMFRATPCVVWWLVNSRCVNHFWLPYSYPHIDSCRRLYYSCHALKQRTSKLFVAAADGVNEINVQNSELKPKQNVNSLCLHKICNCFHYISRRRQYRNTNAWIEYCPSSSKKRLRVFSCLASSSPGQTELKVEAKQQHGLQAQQCTRVISSLQKVHDFFQGYGNASGRRQMFLIIFYWYDQKMCLLTQMCLLPIFLGMHGLTNVSDLATCHLSSK